MIHTYAQAHESFRRRYWTEALVRNGWHEGKTAAEAGVHRNTVGREMKLLGIARPPAKKRIKRISILSGMAGVA
jgi:DNA-binding NtrC family response regulator